ncbi:conjugal transfer pilus assembly protein TraB [Citrobacter freundii]|nr:conjugal transfer pilus assembly protein TraB [Citrobacter freundii]
MCLYGQERHQGRSGYAVTVQILLYAGGAGFLDGNRQGIEKASSTTVGVGATASMSAGDIGQAGLGGGVSFCGQNTL